VAQRAEEAESDLDGQAAPRERERRAIGRVHGGARTQAGERPYLLNRYSRISVAQPQEYE